MVKYFWKISCRYSKRYFRKVIKPMVDRRKRTLPGKWFERRLLLNRFTSSTNQGRQQINRMNLYQASRDQWIRGWLVKVSWLFYFENSISHEQFQRKVPFTFILLFRTVRGNSLCFFVNITNWILKLLHNLKLWSAFFYKRMSLETKS